MAYDMLMKVDGVTGESKNRHATGGEIDVLAWSWGASQSGTAHVGGGAGAGRVNVQDMSFTKYIDKSSTDLMLFCCNGKHVTECILSLFKAGGDDNVNYLKVTMTDCLISSVSVGGSGGEDRLTENVTLNFAKVNVEYTPQKEDGSAEAPTTMGWDIAKNEKV